MDESKADNIDELDFPQRFLDEVEELARRTDDGDSWAELLYGKWFVCPTETLNSTLEISLERRRNYVSYGTDDSDRLDVLVDSPNLLEESTDRGFELPHVSLHDLITNSIGRFLDWSSDSPALLDADKPDAVKMIDDIEKTVASAIAELRALVNR